MMSESKSIRTIAVLGTGEMGHGIAENLAMMGYNVHLYDISDNVLNNAMKRIIKSLKIFKRKRKIKEDVSVVLERITIGTDYNEMVSNVEVVIEAVPEIMSLKQNLYKKIEEIYGGISDTQIPIIASNTSSFSIETLVENLNIDTKQYVCGMHFFNPPVLMKSVEIIKGTKTSDKTISTIQNLVNKMNKVGVVCKDSPGFVINRVQSAAQILLCQAVEKKIIKPHQIDAKMKSMGIVQGPFETMDFSGLDIVKHAMDYMGKVLGPDYLPPSWITKLVENNHLGKKTGQGVYKWDPDTQKAIIKMDDITEEITPLDLMLVQINEATKLLENEIVNCPQDIDLLIKNGTANPMGIFGLLKRLGKEKVIECCEKYNILLSLSCFQPTSLIKNWDSSKFV